MNPTKAIKLIGFFTWVAVTVSHPLGAQNQERMLVRIQLENILDFNRLKDLNLDLATHRMDLFAEVVATRDEIDEIESRGFSVSVIPEDFSRLKVSQYRTYEDIIELCRYYSDTYPEIVTMDTLGYSQVWQLWMPVLKVSDNPGFNEDEPAVLFDGLHHAREPVGMESALYILDHLLRNYGIDDQVSRWVNEMEIWFIPMMNPEGYKYLIDNNLASPWWRKNLRDNDDNGVINEDMDGVDLNRNYDYNFDAEGSGDPSNWTYRGPSPFSESETRAKRDLALQQKFLLSNTYHSYGEVVIYSWSNMADPPDKDLIIEIAQGVASRIPKLSGNGSYDYQPSSGLTGFSKNWMYAMAGTIEFTVETATRFIPTFNQGIQVAQSNLQGGLYLLERAQGPGITGHVTDQVSGQPLSAGVQVIGVDNELITLRTSDSAYGRFWRLLQEGTYSMRFSKLGYITQNVNNIQVNDSTWTEIEVQLQPESSGIQQDIAAVSEQALALRIYPNPSSGEVYFAFETRQSSDISIEISDLSGKTIQRMETGLQPAGTHEILWHRKNLSRMVPGIYLVKVIAGDRVKVKRLIFY